MKILNMDPPPAADVPLDHQQAEGRTKRDESKKTSVFAIDTSLEAPEPKPPKPPPISTAELVRPFFDLCPPKITYGMPFEQYQAIPAVNASLLRQPTPFEMVCYLGAMHELPAEAQWLVESKGADVEMAMEMTQEMKPRTVPRNYVIKGRNPGREDRITPGLGKVIDALTDVPQPAELFHTQSLNKCLGNGWATIVVKEEEVEGVSESVKEGRAQALAIGDATHKAILEPHMWDMDTWQKHWQLSPTGTLTSKLALQAQLDDPTRRLITPEIVDTARRCRDAVWRHKFAAKLLSLPGKSEVVVEAFDPVMMCRRKIRIDRLPDDVGQPIIDVKTSRKKMHAFKGAIYEFGYDVQDAFYLDTLAMVEGAERPGFMIIAVTKAAPFIARVFELNQALPEESFYVRGKEIYEERFAKFVLANEEQKWTAYEDEAEAMLLTTR